MSKAAVLTLLAAVAVAVTLAIGVVIAISGESRDLVLDLGTGACLDLPGSVADGDLALVDTVACGQPHQAEVIATGVLEGALADSEVYPGVEPLLAAADVRCAAALDELDAGGRFGAIPVVPDEPSWARYAGHYVCVAVPYGGGTTTGSVARPQSDP
jgi:hypothetical protein